MTSKASSEQFRRNVLDKYIIYNSLFAALPFSGVANAGALLPILLQHCYDGYEKGRTPVEIIDRFFKQQAGELSQDEKLQRLFKFVQYIERQVVLFDAIEDAAFPAVNNLEGPGSLKNLWNRAVIIGKQDAIREKLKDYRIRIVLTAHPTQFYPGTVLGIIHDMAQAIAKNDFETINGYIQQLGITPFFNKQKPTPYDEAVNLMWYLENIFYHSIGHIYNFINDEIFEGKYNGDNAFVELGFWPGGDRDGNPFVDAETTLKVANALRTIAILCYYRNIRQLKRRLTFQKIDKKIAALEQLLYENIFLQATSLELNKDYLLKELYAIREILIAEDHSLFLSELDSFIHKVKIFGTHFATLDIRQNSKIHRQVLDTINNVVKEKEGKGFLPDDYDTLDEPAKAKVLSEIHTTVDMEWLDDIAKETIASCRAIRIVQKANGEAGCHRYIISNCESAANVMEVYALLRLSGWEGDMNVDIVPLFETIDDLKAAEGIMEQLYTDPVYGAHLAYRKNHQDIMLGFSDGTKDGGYLQANWSIYLAKETLTRISKKYEVEIVFFDGRGGPPSRGGGKTHAFYASMGSHIESNEIQITIQGQTISSNYGTTISAQYNTEQLLSAGLSGVLNGREATDISAEQRSVIEELAQKSHEAYQQFKGDPLFMPYLERMSPLNYYSNSNIASRPAKRSDGGPLKFEDLRAIPFVGSWAQIKQNVPGYFGLGKAFQHFEEAGRFSEVQAVYDKVPFFRALIENSMMSMLKSFFPLTQYISSDLEFGAFRQQIEQEFKRSEQFALRLSNSKELLQSDAASRESILLRDKIVLPLLTIQQYALQQLHTHADMPAEQKEVYEKLITRSMFGIINAARNSA